MKRYISLIVLLVLASPIFCCNLSAQTMPDGQTEALLGFGKAVAVDGDHVIIGEPDNPHQPGMVYVYDKSTGEWAEKAKLMASDGNFDNRFGTTLSAKNGHIVVGAPGHSNNLGKVYLYSMENGKWAEQEAFSLPDSLEGTRFGSSVLLHDDLLLVGAPAAAEKRGAVYTYEKSDDNWVQQAEIISPDTTAGTAFGSSLAIEGGQGFIGAPRREGGAVFVFERDDMGSWNEKTLLAPGRLGSRAGFGSTMGVQNDMALIAAPGHMSASGVVFVYTRNDEMTEEWSNNGRMVAYDSEPRYMFGSSMAFVDNEAWIGAPRADGGKGAIYRFKHSQNSSGWSGVEKLSGTNSEKRDRFAGSFAVGNNVAIVSLTGADYGAGKAAILEKSSNENWVKQTTIQSEPSTVLQPITGKKVKCKNGKADRFSCEKVDMLSFLPIDKIGGERGVRLNDIWGWTDPETGKEYALIGRNEGTSFVDVSDPYDPVFVGTIPMPETAQSSVWRDIKVYKNHAYIVADNADRHGMQVVDLTDLREFDGSPIQLEEVAHYKEIHSSHNIVINTESGFAYAVGNSGGGKTCGGGLHMINIQEPANPTFAGCFSDPSTGRSGTGYTHDAQCVMYDGPDPDYKGREICVGSNETAISIADVTDKETPKAISTASYPDYGYVHQGWFTEDQRYFFQNDELDEITGTVDNTRTLIWDLKDLDDPQFVKEFFIDNPSIDHNLYIKDGIMYQSNYVSGLQVIDVSDPENPVKIGHFDTLPFGEDKATFSGSWSNYPYFDSGIIIINSSREGFFILKNKSQKLNL